MKLPKGFKLPEGAQSLGINIPGMEPSPKPNKYKAKPKVYAGVRYASKAEAERAEFLDGLASIGLRWIGQPRFRLGCPENLYVADFLVWGSLSGDGSVYVEDVKGHRTAKFARDVRLWRAYGPCQLWIITKGSIEYVNGGRDAVAILNGTTDIPEDVS